MEYGINILGIIPLRKEPKDQSEMVSQVLFGQHFKILEIKPSWVCIQLADDDYEGWICAKQYYEITYEDYDNLNLNDFPKVGDKLSYLEETISGEKHPHTTRKYTTLFSSRHHSNKTKKIQVQWRNC